MPALLDAGDRRLLIGAGVAMVVLLVLTFALAPAPKQQSIGTPSSYSSEWAGGRAAFLLLGELGYRVEHWERSPVELPGDPRRTVLILAEPSEGASSDELLAIRQFVTGGGRVLALGGAAAGLVPDAKALLIPDWNLQSKTFSALAPSPLTRNAPEITMIAPDQWTGYGASQLGVYGTADKPVVVTYPVGRGEVIWWASSSPLSNGLIREKGNLAFFLNAVGPTTSRVLWDEYFHGARRSLVSYFAETPLPWAGLQVAIAFLAALFTFSRRSGPIRGQAVESRLSPLEFVETLGDLYESANASPAAVGVAYQRFRTTLSRKTGVSTQAKLPEIARVSASRFGWPEAALLDTLARSERAMRNINLDQAEALELVRELHDYSNRIESARLTKQEKT
ncbi:MAG TPA: DUF4350 domain-containing protein [Candidatus Baltobacteraceae bacterium]|nr:DUF4350 domain-containing protein [Candidatus Baltobacteraceae bacterium]